MMSTKGLKHALHALKCRIQQNTMQHQHIKSTLTLLRVYVIISDGNVLSSLPHMTLWHTEMDDMILLPKTIEFDLY